MRHQNTFCGRFVYTSSAHFSDKSVVNKRNLCEVLNTLKIVQLEMSAMLLCVCLLQIAIVVGLLWLVFYFTKIFANQIEISNDKRQFVVRC